MWRANAKDKGTKMQSSGLPAGITAVILLVAIMLAAPSSSEAQLLLQVLEDISADTKVVSRTQSKHEKAIYACSARISLDQFVRAGKCSRQFLLPGVDLFGCECELSIYGCARRYYFEPVLECSKLGSEHLDITQSNLIFEDGKDCRRFSAEESIVLDLEEALEMNFSFSIQISSKAVPDPDALCRDAEAGEIGAFGDLELRGLQEELRQQCAGSAPDTLFQAEYACSEESPPVAEEVIPMELP